MDITDNALAPDNLYENLSFPDAEGDIPYIYANMVCTIDGKTLLGPRGTSAKGLGGDTDQLLMRRIQNCSEAAIVGASTLRVGHVIYPQHLIRAVVTRSGDVPWSNRFFTDCPRKAIVFAPMAAKGEGFPSLPEGVRMIQVGEEDVDVEKVARILRAQFNIRRLLLEGGAILNGHFFRAGLVRELFLTLAPKLKGGDDSPGLMDGKGFEGNGFRELTLLSLYRAESELYARYRVGSVKKDDAYNSGNCKIRFPSTSPNVK